MNAVLWTMLQEALVLDALLSLQSSVDLDRAHIAVTSACSLVKNFAPESAAIVLAKNDPDAVLLTTLNRTVLWPFQTQAQSKQTHKHQQLKAFPCEAEDASSQSMQV